MIDTSRPYPKHHSSPPNTIAPKYTAAYDSKIFTWVDLGTCCVKVLLGRNEGEHSAIVGSRACPSCAKRLTRKHLELFSPESTHDFSMFQSMCAHQCHNSGGLCVAKTHAVGLLVEFDQNPNVETPALVGMFCLVENVAASTIQSLHGCRSQSEIGNN